MFNLKIARMKKGLSQKELADMLGVNSNTVSRWETGMSIMTVDKLIEITRILEVSSDFLIGIKE